MRDTEEMERDIVAFAHSSNGGLIVTTSALATVYRDFIIKLAARHKLPAIYFQRVLVPAGRLISYGPNLIDQFKGAAGYVDRILRARSRPTCRCRRRPNMSW